MLKFKRIIPSSLKNNLRKRFYDEVFKIKGLDSSVSDRIAELERAVFELQPEVVMCTNEITEAINKEWALNNISIPANLNISKHDYMYQFLKEYYRSAIKAYTYYITSGAHMMSILQTIAAKKWKSFANINSLLDFASGYGRLTRYTVELIKPEQIWISDIKQGAIKFQIQQFNVNGVVSCEDPDHFFINKKFDFIFVGSLFSHLPEKTFGKWLGRIYQLLNEDGVMVFTVHDQSLMRNYNPSITKGKLVYSEVSEELNLVSQDGRLPGTHYGTAYVDETFVKKEILKLNSENLHYTRYKKGMWELQDLYILSKDTGDLFSNLVF